MSNAPRTCNISILRRAQKELAKLAAQDQAIVAMRIAALVTNPGPDDCKKLKNREGWRIRIGVYRVLDTINDDQLVVVVFKIGHPAVSIARHEQGCSYGDQCTSYERCAGK